MKATHFNATFKRLLESDGKQYFEEALQYAGWFFLNLTEKQHNKVTGLLVDWGYPLETREDNTWVILPNGIQLLLNF